MSALCGAVGRDDIPICLDEIWEDGINSSDTRDSRNAIINIALFFKGAQIQKKAANKIIKDWASNKNGVSSLDKNLIENEIDRVYKSNEVFTCEQAQSCHYINELCDKEGCIFKPFPEPLTPIVKDNKETAKQEDNSDINDMVEFYLGNCDPVEFIMNTFNKYHIGDRQLGTVMLLSVANQSIINSEGIQPKLSGASGKGKTHAAKTMYALLPDYHKIEGSLSAKTLFYSPDLEEGTVIFSDDVKIGADLEDTLKRAMSNFQTPTIHRTVNGDREYDELEIPPRICWWMTSVDSPYSDELNNRLYDITVDSSVDTDREVTSQQLNDAATGRTTFPDPEDEDVRVCNEIILRIKMEKFKVKIPFARRIIWNGYNDRRNLPRLLALIKGFTVMRHQQRKEESDNVYLADIQDYYDAVALMGSNEEELSTKLTGAEVRFIKWAGGKEFISINEVVSSYLKEDGTQYTYEAIRKMVFGTARKAGLLSKVPGMTEKQDGQERKFKVPRFETIKTANKLVYLAEEEEPSLMV